MQQRIEKYQAINRDNIDKLPQFQNLSAELQHAIKVVSLVFPFRTNKYVVEHLIDWNRVPYDPIYQLTFPQQGMLGESDFSTMSDLYQQGTPWRNVQAVANAIRLQHNPHPGGQLQYNVPQMDGVPVAGLQHKYRETVLFFPSHGQTCHAYCSYCFRWAQFVGIQDLKFAAAEASQLNEYLRHHPEVSDVLITGGDPAVMRTTVMQRYLEPLLQPELSHIQTIRIGTKALAYWPQRFVTDPDADELLRLFERIIASNRHVAIMGHYSHHREFALGIAEEAIRRLRSVGCEIRMQAPLIRYVNDDPDVWIALWQQGVRLGLIPYYMFVSRDTGPREYYKVPLTEVLDVFRQAYSQVSGLARTVRGPVMSATPGKILINGITDIQDQRVFVLSFLQGRDSQWVGRPFFAHYDSQASWISDLKPAFGGEQFFFEDAEMVIKLPHDLEGSHIDRE